MSPRSGCGKCQYRGEGSEHVCVLSVVPPAVGGLPLLL
jgi:threonine dehydrogenase-like Zn-dependent dehydrogenase